MIATAPALESPAPPARLPSNAEVLEWLRESRHRNAAPFRPKAPSLVESLKDGELFWSSYARGIALVFSGTRTFIDQWFNLAVNRGIVGPGAKLLWYEGGYQGSVAYVCPRDKDAVRRGLIAQFGWELVRDRAVPVTRLTDPETETITLHWDEAAVEERATLLADDFIARHIRTSGIVLDRPKTYGHVYEVPRRPRTWTSGEEAA